MLKQRIFTAIILIPLVIMAIFYTSPLVFDWITAGVLLAAAWEWANLAQYHKTHERIIYLFITAVCFYLSHFIPIHMLFIAAILWWLWVSYSLIKQPRILKSDGYRYRFNNTIVASIGIFVLTTCFASLTWLKDQNQSWVMVLLIIVWAADTFAYFSGKCFGKHWIAPTISPKKTWEGAYGALLGVAVLTGLMGYGMAMPLGFLLYLTGLGLLTVVVSIIGDLFESLLKRQSGVKDSGQLLPGHGGLLDRIDSLLAAAPFFAAGVMCLH